MKLIKKEFLELAENPAGRAKALDKNPGNYPRGEECGNSPFFCLFECILQANERILEVKKEWKARKRATQTQ